MDKKTRRMLAAGGWLGICVLAVTVIIFVVLHSFSEKDLMTEMLDAFVDTAEPSDTGSSPDYGGVVLIIVGVFFVLGAVFLLSASGLAFAAVGIKTLFDCKKEQNARPASFAKRNIVVSSIAFVLDGAALVFMVCLLFSSWHPAERVTAIGCCAVLLSCLVASVVLNGIVLSYMKSGSVSAEVF